ncbi:MAG: cell division protein FtsQ [Porticoccaceae bacterium]|nr:cell division protein FtsQ [Porticoccaceae bacterium]
MDGTWQLERQRPLPAAPQGRWRRWSRIAVAVVSLAFVLAGAAGLAFLYRHLDVPIALIGVDGTLEHLDAREVEKIVVANMAGGFLSLDLDAIRAGLEAHPWVASASARRQWPDSLIIDIEEEVPIARWGDRGVLNNRGIALEVGEIEGLAALPLLEGPEGLQRRVMQHFRMFAQLLQPIGLKIHSFRMGPRGGWYMTFVDGPELAVGRGQVTDKIERFLLVWEKALEVRIDQIERVDIRYGNGVAVRWKQQDGNKISDKREHNEGETWPVPVTMNR